jgi:hypothetical protein
MRKLLTTIVTVCLFTTLNAQIQPVKVELSDPKSFSMIILPDIQSYIKFDVNQPIAELMTAWIANNADRLNIATVMGTGDIVEQNNLVIPDGLNGNQTGTQQWEYASRCFERLDGVVPYILATGNHDFGYVSAENRQTNYGDYFPVERNTCWKKCLVEAYNNFTDKPALYNAAFEFETRYWGKMLVLAIEFAPRPEVVDWAIAITKNKKYENHKIILLTHSYTDIDASRFVKEGYGVNPATYGEEIWQKLVYPSSNIVMVVCGHAASGDQSPKNNVSFRTDKNRYGKPVAQMMFNAQTMGGGWNGNGGDGWLRILEFMPDGKTIEVRTFSPLFAISPASAQFAFRTEPFDQFEINVE